MTTTYFLPNGASQLVFSSATTSYGARSGSGSAMRPPLLTRASIRSMILRASSRRSLASSQRGDSGIRKNSSTAIRRFSHGQEPQEPPVVDREPVVRDDAADDDEEQEDADGLAGQHHPGAAMSAP